MKYPQHSDLQPDGPLWVAHLKLARQHGDHHANSVFLARSPPDFVSYGALRQTAKRIGFKVLFIGGNRPDFPQDAACFESGALCQVNYSATQKSFVLSGRLPAFRLLDHNPHDSLLPNPAKPELKIED
jgi:hypothetical protein